MVQELILVCNQRSIYHGILGTHRGDGKLFAQVADALEQQAATIERLTAEREALKSVMIAAAEEIHQHWEAHCDAEGYGPANLMRRLEDGIPAQYGYTAGAFAELKAERDALRADAERWRKLPAFLEKYQIEYVPLIRDIDAARKEKP